MSEPSRPVASLVGWWSGRLLLGLVLLLSVLPLKAQSGGIFPQKEGDRARYGVQIDFKKAYLSGVCVMLEEDGMIKASVVNEFGVSALDFTYDLAKRKVKIHHVMAGLNKWYIKRVLKRDLRAVMTLLPDGQNTYENKRFNIRYAFDPMP